MRWSNIFNKSETYLEVGEEQIQLVQSKAGEIVSNQSFERQTEELSPYLNKLKDFPQQVTLLIPAVKTFTRVLDLPREAKERLAEIIHFQFLEQLPCAADDLYFTYYIAREEETRIKVLACAVVKEYVDQMIGLCQQAEVEVASIVPAPLVFYLLHQNSPADREKMLYVDSGLDYFNFTFLSTDNIYIRSSKIKDIKETLFYLDQEYNLEAINPSLLNQEEIDFVKETQERPSEFWFKINEAAEIISKQPLIDSSEQVKSGFWKKVVITASVLGLVLIINFIFQWNLKQQRLNDLERKLNQVQPAVRRVNQLKQQIFTSRKKMDNMEKEINWRNSYLPWLQELAKILGSEVRIKKINFKNDQLVLLSGIAPSASKVMDSLEHSPYFENLSFSGNIENLAEGERFKIVGDLDSEIK
ncbi:type II secretion system protein GspL [Sporohalobacter salinus]|uniref:type II secretion system protein GspL n=1 Tax=Sporohalobacter salinus TaxID=1494606 RepID=UPI00195F31C8|nr:type II secretion system protein GspL [Sporohalobacter salinus]MBM7623787.1 hypothetical protein [Sporohalobacter salinus]